MLGYLNFIVNSSDLFSSHRFAAFSADVLFYFGCSFSELGTASILVSAAGIASAADWHLVPTAMLPFIPP